eukprot:7613623-Pyramimonas_sp.AAC.1
MTKGGYYPLGWYKRQGFPCKRIRTTCTDTLSHPILGMCYKVDIHLFEKWEAQIASRSRTEWVDAQVSDEGDVNENTTMKKKAVAASQHDDQ